MWPATGWAGPTGCEGSGLTARARKPPASGGHLVLARAAARPLAGDDLPPQEELASPDAPGLPALDGAGEAGDHDRATPAERLRVLDVGGCLSEEQVGILPAGKVKPPGNLGDHDLPWHGHRLLRRRPQAADRRPGGLPSLRSGSCLEPRAVRL